MAEGFLKSFDSELLVYSAGTTPSAFVHPKAVQVMAEAGVDLSQNQTKSLDEFLEESFDYLITVCDNAKEACPAFPGTVGARLHMGFEDPADAEGTDAEVLSRFRRVRDQIKAAFYEFYKEHLFSVD